jgi:uncharacterized protein YrzB (UPF0473 family)
VSELTGNEKVTPVTPEEADDIRVTLELEDGNRECMILTIFDVGEQDYIALMPLNPDGSEPDEGDVYLYRYSEDEQGLPQIDFIGDDDEFEAVSDRFDELLDENMYENMDS